MMELRHILERTAADPDDRSVLATLVDVKGSGYRLAGARMLIDGNGRSIGMVSGGCLEADILERAKEVRHSGEPTVVSYDTTKDDSNSVFGLGMGCRGVVRVLLESTRNNDALNFIRTCFGRREKGAITTLISKTGDVGLPLTSRIFSQPSKDGFGLYRKSFAELNGLSTSVSRDAAAALHESRSRSVMYRDANGSLEFFHEVITPPTALFIFGAGHDAVPLARWAANLGWKISVIDHRPAYAAAERFGSRRHHRVSTGGDSRHGFYGCEFCSRRDESQLRRRSRHPSSPPWIDMSLHRRAWAEGPHDEIA